MFWFTATSTFEALWLNCQNVLSTFCRCRWRKQVYRIYYCSVCVFRQTRPFNYNKKMYYGNDLQSFYYFPAHVETHTVPALYSVFWMIAFDDERQVVSSLPAVSVDCLAALLFSLSIIPHFPPLVFTSCHYSSSSSSSLIIFFLFVLIYWRRHLVHLIHISADKKSISLF